ncbi:MAG: hypothetical protein LBD49_02325 [Oscillospiraceae bacterium]|nr:hypothetical protein [Oscillospiraceae bacterium]
MEKKFTVTRAGRPLGEACLARSGLMTEISYSGGSPDSENVYRLAAVCNGRYVPLGVPAPSGDAGSGRFEIKKSFTKNALREIGFAEPSAFELILTGEEYAPAPMAEPAPEAAAESCRLTGEWSQEPDPERFFADGGEAAFTEKARGALARTDGETIYIAVPISSAAPFPMTPVFCLGEPETIDGEDYLVFKLKNGALAL